METDKIIIYCDGACSGNQFKENRGGWGAILRFKEKEKEINGGEIDTTNQKMELTACIKALEQLKKKDIKVEIYSDSAYLINCMQQKWYINWRKNGWRNQKKEPVANKELWIQLLNLVEPLDIDFFKVEGHSGDPLNERADFLARKGIEELDPVST